MSINCYCILPFLPRRIRQKLILAQVPIVPASSPNMTFRQAVTIEDYAACFRLLHDTYVAAGLTTQSIPALRIVPHHANPDAVVLMGRLNQPGTLLYTASLFPDSTKYGLPMEDSFNRQVNTLRSQGRKLVEVGCLATNSIYRKKDKLIPLLGDRLVLFCAANVIQADDLLTTVHPKHVKIYEGVFLFEKLGRASSYSYVNGNPAVAFRLDLNTIQARCKKAWSSRPDLYHLLFESKPTCFDIPKDCKSERGINMLRRTISYANAMQ